MRILFALLLLGLTSLFSSAVFALNKADLLPPDKAFQLDASVSEDGQSLRLRWDVTEGYYLYKKNFSFESATPSVTLASDRASYPPSKIKDDPNFGEMEVYYDDVVIEVPLVFTGDVNATQDIDLTVKTKHQGCAEAGLCYPPQRKTTTVKLAKSETTPTNETVETGVTTAVKTDVTNTLKTEELDDKPTATPKGLKFIPGIIPKPIPLGIEQAFNFSIEAIDQSTLLARWVIAKDHHLYQSKIHFQSNAPETVTLGKIDFPPGKVVDDAFFGKMEVYDSSISIEVPFESNGKQEFKITTEYQGCANKSGICYPPVTQETLISLDGLPERQVLGSNSNNNTALTNEFFSGSFLGTLAFFFVIGLGLSLTPCIFPMIPILSGIIAGQSNLSASKAFSLSLTYVIASASAYALIGLVFGFFGENLQASLQHPVAIALFAGLFVILACSMFGFFDLQMPVSIQSRLNEISNNQRSGSLLGAAIMGFISTLIVGPCVAPALAAALTYIANSKDALLGASALFSMGFGMGVILLVVGTLGGHLLPRAGAWMDTTKAIFGIMLLGMAIWMLDRIVPIGITMALTGILLVASGIYMGALDKLSEEAGGWDRFWKSIGLILLFYGTMQLFGFSAGSQNILQPLKGLLPGSNPALSTPSPAENARAANSLSFQRIEDAATLKSALSRSTALGQPAMLDFYADWCVDCIRMETNVFSDPAVSAMLANFSLLKADVTERTDTNRALEKNLGIIGPPTIIFFDKNGNEINDLRMIGYESTPIFLERLKKILQN